VLLVKEMFCNVFIVVADISTARRGVLPLLTITRLVAIGDS
jgi:hypothetical protein